MQEPCHNTLHSAILPHAVNSQATYNRDPPDATSNEDGELRVTGPTAPRPNVARGGAFSFLGAITSALMGFVVVIVLGRTLGTDGAGYVLQGVAAFTIALGVARVGLDTTAVWILPRLSDDEASRRQVRPAVIWLLLPSLAFGAVAGGGLYLTGHMAGGDLGRVFKAMAWCMPAASITTVALAATRGLGGVKPYIGLNSMAIPSSRPVLIGLAAVAGAGTAVAAFVWAAPFLVAAPLGLLILGRRVLRLERRHSMTPEPWWPQRELRRKIRRYSVPRTVAVILEQAMLWLDVLLVGLLAGPAAAGIYGAATRFIAAGYIVSTALRIVVAPLYSRLLGRGDHAGVQELYTVSTTWIVLFSAPACALFATFGGTLLAVLGPGFSTGALTMVILSIGLTVILLGGNVQVLLLMSALSGSIAIFKTISLVVLTSGMLALVPTLGITGGAIAWSVSMTVDTVLAIRLARAKLGLRVGGVAILTALVIGGGVPVAIALTTQMLMGDGGRPLTVALLSAGAVYLCAVYLLRRRLHLDEILTLFARRS